MARVKFAVGDVIEFALPTGYHYLQVSWIGEAKYGYPHSWARVLPGEFDQPVDGVDALAQSEEAFFVTLDYTTTIPVGPGMRMCGRAPVPPGHEKPTVVRSLHRPVGDRVRWKISGPGDLVRFVFADELSLEDAKAPIGVLNTVDDVARYLRTDWTPTVAMAYSVEIGPRPDPLEPPQEEVGVRPPAGTFEFVVEFADSADAAAFARELTRSLSSLVISQRESDEGQRVFVRAAPSEDRDAVQQAIEALLQSGQGEVISTGTFLEQP